MKICVISDSHGRKDKLEELLSTQSFNYVFFLGDGLSDIRDVENQNIKKVCGNCDIFSNEAHTQIINILNFKVMITHGHDYKVKLNTFLLLKFAKDHGIKLVCYGHTHRKSLQVIDGVMLLNPGAFKEGEYAVVEIDNKGGIGVNFESYR